MKRRHDHESLDRPRQRLTAALSTADALHETGYPFVVAPQRTNSGDVLHQVDDRLALALYPFIQGQSHGWGPYPLRDDRLAVLDLIVAIHQAPAATRQTALVDDFIIPHRDDLTAALTDHHRRWEGGPFSEPARALIKRHQASILDLLHHYDLLAATVSTQRSRIVITHGEPHRANTISTSSGVMLIDWDTTLIAPPERDLWGLADEDPSILDEYLARTGARPETSALEAYRLRWRLAEIATYVAQFREKHSEDDDTRLAWTSLFGYVEQ